MHSACSDSVVDSNKNKIFKNLESDEEWLSTVEAAAYLKISPRSLLNMCSNGSISYYKLGNRNRYRRDDLEKLLVKKGGHCAKNN